MLDSLYPEPVKIRLFVPDFPEDSMPKGYEVLVLVRELLLAGREEGLQLRHNLLVQTGTREHLRKLLGARWTLDDSESAN